MKRHFITNPSNGSSSKEILISRLVDDYRRKSEYDYEDIWDEIMLTYEDEALANEVVRRISCRE